MIESYLRDTSTQKILCEIKTPHFTSLSERQVVPQGEHGGEQSALQLEDSQGLVKWSYEIVYIQIHHQLLQNLEGLVLGNMLNLL